MSSGVRHKHKDKRKEDKKKRIIVIIKIQAVSPIKHDRGWMQSQLAVGGTHMSIAMSSPSQSKVSSVVQMYGANSVIIITCLCCSFMMCFQISTECYHPEAGT